MTSTTDYPALESSEKNHIAVDDSGDDTEELSDSVFEYYLDKACGKNPQVENAGSEGALGSKFQDRKCQSWTYMVKG